MALGSTAGGVLQEVPSLVAFPLGNATASGANVEVPMLVICPAVS